MTTKKEYTIRIEVEYDTDKITEQEAIDAVIMQLDTVSDEIGWGGTGMYESKGVVAEDGIQEMHEWSLSQSEQ